MATWVRMDRVWCIRPVAPRSLPVSGRTGAVGETVTSRVTALLGAFDAGNSVLSLSELARRCGLPLTTVHRLVGELVRAEFLERDEDGRYRIGLRLWGIATSASRAAALRETALPFLQQLFEATHQNVQLAVLDGTEAVYVERISGAQSVHVVSRVGMRLPLHATGVGLVLLAYASVELQERVLAAPLARFTRYTLTDPRRIRRVLATVRREGVVVSDRQIETISSSVAAPVRDRAGQVVAAVSVVVPSSDELRSYLPAVRRTADAISRHVLAIG
jgi:DNA-binding IclR family transcriptional regulator